MKQPRTFYLLLALLAGASLGLIVYAGPLSWIGRMAASAAPPQEDPVTIQELGPVQFVEEPETMASVAQLTEDLLVDDGSVENFLTLNQPGTISLVNRLQPSMYPATLSELRIFFASGVGLTQGSQITLLVGSNPDGDANINGTAFQQVNATIQSLGQLNIYSVSNLNFTINSGDFVVGFRITTQANVGVGALDTTPPSRGRSYFSTDGVNFTSVDTLGGGNLVIRAQATIQQQPPPPAGNLEALVAPYIDANRGDNGTGDLTILNNLAGAGAVDGNILTQGVNAEVVIAPSGQYAIAHPTGINADSVSIITGLNASPFESQVLPIGNFPNAVAISSDSTTAIAVNGLTSPITYRVITGLPNAPVVSSLFSIPSATNTVAEDVALSPSGDTAVISLFQNNEAVVIGGVRSGSPSVRGIVNVGSGPNGVAFLPNGNTAFVANTLDNSIEVISGLLPGNLPFGVRRIPVAGPNPQAIQLTPDGSKLVATNTGGNTVAIFQVIGGDNLSAPQTLNVGQNPAGLAVSSDGRTALVANAGSNTVSIIRGLDTGSPFVGPTLGPSAQLDTATFVERSVALAAVAGPPAAPDIDVTPTSLNFGNVTVGAFADQTVTVQNFGNATLTVNSISSNNARFTVVSPGIPFNVAPGGSQGVTVRFSPNAVGPQNGTLTITSNDPDEANVFVPLSGNGVAAQVPDINVTPTSLNFGNVTVGAFADQTVTVQNFGNATLTVNSISSNNARFTVVSPGIPFNVAPGGSQGVTVRFSPNAVGPQNGTLTITSNDPDEANVFVPLSGNGVAPQVPDINVTPTSLNFGNVTVGAFADLTLTVQNFGNATLTVNSISSNNARFSVVAPIGPFNVAAGGSQGVTVRFSPNAVGPQNGTLTITSNDPDEATVFVSLSGNGVAPQVPDINVTPTSLNFGSVTVGAFADLTLTVQNLGNATLTVNSISSNNARFSVVAPIGPFNMAAGGSQGVTVRFSPNAVGPQNGTLTITSNDPDEATVFVSLSGNGVAPQVPDINVTPTSLNFGNVTVGAFADQTVTVQNFGNATLTVNSISSNNARFTVVSPGIPFNVAPGGSQGVTVRFSPNAVGVQNGTLTITSNDPDEATVFVPLSGNGQAAGDPNEPNDSPQQTTFIPTPSQGQSVSIMGDATPDDLGTAADQFNTECPPPGRTVQDWFRLEVNQRAAIQLSLTFQGANIDFDLLWFIQNNNFPQGVQLMAVSLQGVGQPETIGTRVLEPGTYIIGVSRVRRNDASDFNRVGYTLTVTRGLSPEFHVLEDVVCVAFADNNAANNGFFVVNRVRPTVYPARLETIDILFLAAQGLPSPAGRPVRIIVFTDPSGSGMPPINPPLIVNQVVNVGGANQFNRLNLGAGGPLITQGDFYVGYVVDTANGIAINMGRALYPNIRSFFSSNGGQTYQQLIRQGQGQPLDLAVRPGLNTRPFGKMSASDSADQLGQEEWKMLRPRVITLDEP